MKGIELLRKSSGQKHSFSQLSPLYTTFLNYYETGVNTFKHQFFMFEGDLIQLSSVTYFGDNNYENSMSHFFNFTDLEFELSRFEAKVDEYHSQGFIQIGLFDISDSILLGVSEDNIETIWKLNGDWGDDIPYKEKIAQNIFEFVNCLKEVTIKMNLTVRNIEEDQLYMNWGEDFWRVK